MGNHPVEGEVVVGVDGVDEVVAEVEKAVVVDEAEVVEVEEVEGRIKEVEDIRMRLERGDMIRKCLGWVLGSKVHQTVSIKEVGYKGTRYSLTTLNIMQTPCLPSVLHSHLVDASLGTYR